MVFTCCLESGVVDALALKNMKLVAQKLQLP